MSLFRLKERKSKALTVIKMEDAENMSPSTPDDATTLDNKITEIQNITERPRIVKSNYDNASHPEWIKEEWRKLQEANADRGEDNPFLKLPPSEKELMELTGFSSDRPETDTKPEATEWFKLSAPTEEILTDQPFVNAKNYISEVWMKHRKMYEYLGEKNPFAKDPPEASFLIGLFGDRRKHASKKYPNHKDRFDYEKKQLNEPGKRANKYQNASPSAVTNVDSLTKSTNTPHSGLEESNASLRGLEHISQIRSARKPLDIINRRKNNTTQYIISQELKQARTRKNKMSNNEEEDTIGKDSNLTIPHPADIQDLLRVGSFNSPQHQYPELQAPRVSNAGYHKGLSDYNWLPSQNHLKAPHSVVPSYFYDPRFYTAGFQQQRPPFHHPGVYKVPLASEVISFAQPRSQYPPRVQRNVKDEGNIHFNDTSKVPDAVMQNNLDNNFTYYNPTSRRQSFVYGAPQPSPSEYTDYPPYPGPFVGDPSYIQAGFPGPYADVYGQTRIPPPPPYTSPVPDPTRPPYSHQPTWISQAPDWHLRSPQPAMYPGVPAQQYAPVQTDNPIQQSLKHLHRLGAENEAKVYNSSLGHAKKFGHTYEYKSCTPYNQEVEKEPDNVPEDPSQIIPSSSK